MNRWWVRPCVRVLAAILLPIVVPAVITGFIGHLPGDPAPLICPPNVCGGTEALARRWNWMVVRRSFFWVVCGCHAPGV